MPDPTTDLLWGARPTATRGPRPTLTVADIAGAAIAVADADGLPAATMQRVAERLGVTKMALYRYVPGKDELVAVMIDTALGEAPEPCADGWRACLRRWTHAIYDRFTTHPWTTEATVGPRPIGPNELTWLERALVALADTPLAGSEALDTVATLAGHARAIAQQWAAATNPEAAIHRSFAQLVEGREDRFPALARALADPGGQGQALDFGLDRVLDGIELLVANRSSGR
ncbi:TetR/AcrR family transcriptional regulator [Actinokineospora auranticolor]|uniref:Regulatory TetR family protein n=1 Tax=Actinokineospora auranticolor TaxID=155976 RepID=A0A2S6GSZ6_9PSEU|nr:TetR/AcrR family transcriptional regulator [Actinokineospora auranticolor]PPK68316.1 regulatory TetR family protein [Actinokineospora auranticolor]